MSPGGFHRKSPASKRSWTFPIHCNSSINLTPIFIPSTKPDRWWSLQSVHTESRIVSICDSVMPSIFLSEVLFDGVIIHPVVICVGFTKHCQDRVSVTEVRWVLHDVGPQFLKIVFQVNHLQSVVMLTPKCQISKWLK